LSLSYTDVPKTMEDNLLWRRFLWEMGESNPDFGECLWHVCKREPLFYINSFVWTYDPRKNNPCLPFITYEYQDESMTRIINAITEQRDALVEKSRDLGATWMVLTSFDYMQRFHRDMAFRCLSRKEDYVDKSGDPDSLFWKLDYIEERMPPFLAVRGANHDVNNGRTNLHIKNLNTQTVIDGESANENACRAGRRTAILRDEEAFCENGFAIDNAASDVTNCQLRVSTPNGIGNSFHQARHSGIEVITIHWSQHPEKAAGLYKITDTGELEILDKEWHDANPDYEFGTEPGGWNGLRSPWYDKQCKRRASKLAIAQELDLDYHGSGSPFFDSSMLSAHKSLYCTPPVWTGAASNLLKRNVEDKALDPMSLWFHTLGNNEPPKNDHYVIGVDISTGTGASDSAINITSVVQRAKVGSYVSNQISPECLADLTFYLCEWLTTPMGLPFVIFDQAGPGFAYGKRLRERHGWAYMYHHINKSDRKGKRSSKPGYPGSGKLELFQYYRAALNNGEYINRSERGIGELAQYVHSNTGVEHVKAQSTDDASGNKQNHGDEAYSDALACLALEFMPEPPKPKQIIPENCWAHRRKRFHEEDAIREQSMEYVSPHWE
jgi:hypothetical protein